MSRYRAWIKEEKCYRDVIELEPRVGVHVRDANGRVVFLGRNDTQIFRYLDLKNLDGVDLCSGDIVEYLDSFSCRATGDKHGLELRYVRAEILYTKMGVVSLRNFSSYGGRSSIGGGLRYSELLEMLTYCEVVGNVKEGIKCK